MKYTMWVNYNEVIVDTDKGQITGKTYEAKETLKMIFPGLAWNREAKAWELDGEKMESEIQQRKLSLERCYNLKAVSPEEAAPKAKTQNYSQRPMNGLCPKCGTYCYGDCESN